MSDVEMEKLATELRVLAELATSLIEKTAPIQFRIAETAFERQAAYRLRYQALIDHGSAKPEDFPDGLEHDEHDARALQVVGWDGDVPIATGRIVLPVAGFRLPTEQAFDLDIEPRGQVVDIGRYTVIHAYAQKENRYFTGLLGFCWLETVRRGYIHVCGTASAGMLRHYRRIGFIVAELTPPHIYYGEERFPCWYDVIGSASILISKWGS